MKRRVLLLLSICTCTVSLVAQPAKYSNEFLSIGVGSRQLGMAGAVQASTGDVYSTYWNPCGMLSIKQAQVGLMHNENFGGITKFDYIGFALNSQGSHALGVSMMRNGVDDIPNTLDLIDENGNVNYDRISTFSVNDYAFLLSYAKKMKVEGLTLGGNAKIIRRIVGKFASAWGFGVDVSAQYKVKQLAFGATLRDATTTYNAWKFNTETFEETFALTGNDIPVNSVELTMPRLLLGASYNLRMGQKFNLITEIDLDITTDGKRNVPIKTSVASIDPRAGLELSFKNILFARCGVNNIQTIPDFDNKKRTDVQPNIGAGFRFKQLSVDYALSVMGDKSSTLYSNIFSVAFAFDKKQ